MNWRLLGWPRAVAEEYLPYTIKDTIRKTLARRLAHRTVTYRELADRKGVPSWRFGEPWTVTFDKPDYYNEIPQEISKLFGRHECHRPFVLEIPEAVVFGQNGFITTQDGEYVAFNFDRIEPKRDAAGQVAYSAVDELSKGGWPLSVPTGQDLPEIDIAVPLLHRWATNYSHWTEEWLTQIDGIRHYTEQTEREPKLLIPSEPPSFIQKSLSMLGYDSDDYVEWDGGPVQVNRLVLPSIRRCRSNTSDDYMRDVSALRWLRNEIHNNIDFLDGEEKNSKEYPSRLLISREEDASTRRIVNWEDIETTLSEQGFQTVVLSEMSYRDQKRLFVGAEVVVGTHGAGLTELMYAPETAVVELYGDYVVPVYYEIAKGLGMTYGCLHCEDIDGDIIVDPDELIDAVDTLTGQERALF